MPTRLGGASAIGPRVEPPCDDNRTVGEDKSVSMPWDGESGEVAVSVSWGMHLAEGFLVEGGGMNAEGADLRSRLMSSLEGPDSGQSTTSVGCELE